VFEFTLKTQARPWASRKLAKAAVGIVAEIVTDAEAVYNFDLVLSEACANVVRHAYLGRGPGELEILLRVEPGSHLELEVADWGMGFRELPPTVQNAAPESEGGRGLFIMSELADVFEVRRQPDGKNLVYMKMTIRGEAWKACE
jgi:serine/threonine-protein kinase RsbW